MNRIEKKLGERVLNACENKEREIVVDTFYYKFQHYLNGLGKQRDISFNIKVNEAYTDYKLWLYLERKGLNEK